jgi:hypothetical protein
MAAPIILRVICDRPDCPDHPAQYFGLTEAVHQARPSRQSGRPGGRLSEK